MAKQKKFMTMDGNTAHSVHLVRLHGSCRHLPDYPLVPDGGIIPTSGRRKAARTCSARLSMSSKCSLKAARQLSSTVRLPPAPLTTTYTASQGPPPHDPEHVQDRRRIAAGCPACYRPRHCLACPLHFRRPQRCHGLPPDWLLPCFARIASRKPLTSLPLPTWLPSRDASRSCTSSMVSARRTKSRRLKSRTTKISPSSSTWKPSRPSRNRGLSPNNPTLRGTAQNPDVFFQAREACNPYYNALPAVVEYYMDEMNKLTGRDYKLFNYYGATGCRARHHLHGFRLRSHRRDHRSVAFPR